MRLSKAGPTRFGLVLANGAESDNPAANREPWSETPRALTLPPVGAGLAIVFEVADHAGRAVVVPETAGAAPGEVDVKPGGSVFVLGGGVVAAGGAVVPAGGRVVPDGAAIPVGAGVL
jgi:S-DNA-T family DNA segregation ATPase FtsK/SpoIIIE